MKSNVLFFVLLVSSIGTLHAQFKINANSIFKAKGTISTNALVNNASAQTNLSEAQLTLLGGDQSVTTSQTILVSTLKIDQGGRKTLSGNWEVNGTLQLVNGIISVGNNAQLLYTGTQTTEGNNNSFVDGYFVLRGSGRKFFPIGTGNVYAPAILEASPDSEVGMRTVSGDAGVILPEGVSANFAGHYWELSDATNSPVSLSLNGLGSFLDSSRPIVLEASAPSATAQSLSGTFSGSFVTSIENATQTILVIGKAAEFSLVIHDLITPFTIDAVNDKLTIENIELTSENKVKLLDRWGVVAAEWKNYTNETEYDFSTLSPGNYVCLVEYSYPGESNRLTAKGMVTVLKTK
ncbi:MAG: gliding motility-associated C-terminal domain-containing protein [Cyclobacteriaceae bacterium]|nr:gliding motility-associated C-terminal domain-containing protein [Cyclobacteriaceae bacterium]